MKYNIISYDDDTGVDSRGDRNTIADSRKAARELINDGYEGVAIYNYKTKEVVEIWDNFPLDEIAKGHRGNPIYKRTRKAYNETRKKYWDIIKSLKMA